MSANTGPLITAQKKLLTALTEHDPPGLAVYRLKLQHNAANGDRLVDLLAEGRAALMFLRNGWKVEMRDSPDLRLERDGEVLFAEVKHFHRKQQDELDEQTLNGATGGLFMPVGNQVEDGVEPWKQITAVAIKKVSQYDDSAPNILVVVSSSESLEMMAPSAAHEYDDEYRRTRNAALRKLNGIMLINTCSFVASGGYSNVEFESTRCAAVLEAVHSVN